MLPMLGLMNEIELARYDAAVPWLPSIPTLAARGVLVKLDVLTQEDIVVREETPIGRSQIDI